MTVRSTIPRFKVVVAIVFAAGCGGADGPAVTTVTRDSAGITIVENSLPNENALDIWRFAEPPQVALGVDEGDPSQQFSNVIGALQLSDGTIVIGDGQSKEIRYFDERGEHLVTVGGPGEGPGEFRFLYHLDRLPGDTVVAGGWPIGWAAWFDREGTYVRNVRLGPFFPSLIGHFLPDGSLLMDVYERGGYGNELEWWAAYGEEDTFRPRGHIARITQVGDTSRMDTLHTIAGEEWFKTGRVRQNLAIHSAPFPRNTHVAWTADRLYVGESGKREIEVLRLDGTLERLIRWEGDSVPVTSRDRDDFREELLGGLNARQQSRRANYERWLTAVPYPDVKPKFKALATDPSARVWVQDWPPATSERDRWTVFAKDGRIIAQVEVPRGLTLLDVGEDYALAVWKDELDLEYVRLYRLEKPPAT